MFSFIFVRIIKIISFSILIEVFIFHQTQIHIKSIWYNFLSDKWNNISLEIEFLFFFIIFFSTIFSGLFIFAILEKIEEAISFYNLCDDSLLSSFFTFLFFSNSLLGEIYIIFPFDFATLKSDWFLIFIHKDFLC